MIIFDFWRQFIAFAFGPLYISAPKVPAPDPAIGQAASQNAAVAKEALEFNKQVYEEGKPRQAELDALTDRVVESFLQTQEQQMGQADDYLNYMKETFRPIEKSLADEAMAFDTEAKRAELRGRAATDVEQAAAVSDAAARRDAARYGVNPSDAAFSENLAGSSLNKTIMKVGAMNTADERARAEGRAFKFDVSGLGRGLPAAGATSTGLALNAGGAALNASTVPFNASIARTGTMNQGFGTAIAGNQSAGNLYSGLYQGQLASYNAGQQAQAGLYGGLGTLAGMAAYKMLPALSFGSSKRIKRKRGDVKDAEIIEEVKKMPVDRWRYKKEASPDQAEHIGPYAEDFARRFKVGDGKTISVIDAAGVTFAAVKGLAKKVDKLEGKVAMIARLGVSHG